MRIVAPPSKTHDAVRTELNDTPERILIQGGPNSGKTRAWLTITPFFPDSFFHVIDPDDGVMRVVNEMGGSEAFPNVVLYPALGYQDLKAHVEEIHRNSSPGDWVVMEMLNRWWEATQDDYTQAVYGTTVAEQLTTVRKTFVLAGEENRSPSLDGYTDWKLIKKLHNHDLLDRLIIYGYLNVVGTTTERPYAEYLDKGMAEQGIFAASGWRPEGEKHLPHLFTTIVRFYRSKKGAYLFDTLREKGIGNDGNPRKLLSATTFTDMDWWAVYSEKSGAFKEVVGE